jgi:hypothetical protein
MAKEKETLKAKLTQIDREKKRKGTYTSAGSYSYEKVHQAKSHSATSHREVKSKVNTNRAMGDFFPS